MIAELTPRAQQPPEEERPQAPERAARPQAAQTEQPAGGGPLLDEALQEHIAHAIWPQCGQCGWHGNRDQGSVRIMRPCLWLLTSVVRYGRVLIVM